jgi:hypothetical protein
MADESNRFKETLSSNSSVTLPKEQAGMTPSSDSTNQPETEKVTNRGRSQKDVLLEIADGLELFHTPKDECFAVVPVENHTENLKINANAFRAWLSREYYNIDGKMPSSQAVADVLEILRGRSLFDSPCTETHIRVAEYENKIFLDLCNEDRQAVRITSDGWEVVPSEDVPIKFRRTGGMLPLPVPERGGSLEELKNFVNVAAQDFVLLLAWLIYCLRPNRPTPILLLNGEHGSAKSTTSETLRLLIDPNQSPLRTKPKNEHDLAISANNSRVLVFDNLSGLSTEMSDSFCRLATGGGLSTRKLYSNDSEVLFNAIRPTILNGIDELATRPDLLDRCLRLNCPMISEESRRTKEDFDRELEETRPRILGALLDKYSEGLRNLQEVKLKRLPRMADFARFATAIFGDEFISRYRNLRRESNALALESSPIATLILSFMEDRDSWVGTATELLELLERRGGERTRYNKYFPKQPNQLSKQINRLAPNLRAVGIAFEHGTGAKSREIKLEKIGEASSSSSSSSQIVDYIRQNASRIEAATGGINNDNSKYDDGSDDDDEKRDRSNDEKDWGEEYFDEGELF